MSNLNYLSSYGKSSFTMANLMSNLMSNRNTEFEIRNVSQIRLSLRLSHHAVGFHLFIPFKCDLFTSLFWFYSFTGFTQKNIGRAISYIAASFSTEFEMKQVRLLCLIILGLNSIKF